MDFETTVKLAIYRTIASTTKAPTSGELAEELGASTREVEDAFRSLREKRLLVLEPGDPSRIRMAPPFSGIETAFRVRIGPRSYDANCVWDSLGIPAALHEDGVVEASDGETGEPMRLEVRGGKPVPRDCVIHFAVPAALWWKDIIHT